jgi:type IX secretion system PorP/SprF family membrane protein
MSGAEGRFLLGMNFVALTEMRKAIIFLVFGGWWHNILKAQSSTTYALQEPFVARYWDNRMALNPASAGGETKARAAAFGRTQFISARNAPFHLLVNADLALKSFGVGVVVNYQSYGSSLDTVSSGIRISNARLAGAYHFNFVNFKLSLGFDAGFVNKQFRYPQSAITNSQTQPDIGAGLMASGDHFYVSASLQHIAPMRFSELDDSVNSRRTGVFSAGYQGNASDGKAKPYASALIRSDFRYVVSDLNAGLAFKFFSIGALYRAHSFPGEPRFLSKVGAQAAGVLYDTDKMSFTLCYSFETFIGRKAYTLNRAAFHEIGAVFRIKSFKEVVIQKPEP